ncbi:MAG TPA: hypothetical protein VH722_15210 [Alphaproteobacteria bacterium]|jgi:hypothetical protein|nr:hypothetical protein [Alphaproteobacteria bacterium]
MLEFNYRQAGEKRPPRHLDDGISFVVRYAAPGAHHEACEKPCQTKSAALNFCVILRNLGGRPTELLQFVCGRPDAVLDGGDLEAAIDRQRTRLETEANPPWR